MLGKKKKKKSQAIRYEELHPRIVLLCTVFRLGSEVEGVLYSWLSLQKIKTAAEVWAPVGQVTQNLEWGVSVGYVETNNVALCESRAEKTNRFPWKEIMFRLHLRRPHKADLSPVCRLERGEEEERIWAATITHTTDTL